MNEFGWIEEIEPMDKSITVGNRFRHTGTDYIIEIVHVRLIKVDYVLVGSEDSVMTVTKSRFNYRIKNEIILPTQ